MTLIETTAAAVLLLVALGLGMKVIVASNSAEQASQRKALATEMLSSLLEEKMAAPAAALTPEEAAKWTVPNEAALLLPKVKLETDVTSVAGPLAGKKVTLKLTWQESSEVRTKPLVLSAWTYPYAVEEKSP